MGKILLVVLVGVGLLIGVGFLVVGVIFIGALGSHSSTSETSASSASTSVVSAQAIRVSALKLWSDYHANEVAADNQYKGKQLIVQGHVGSINKDAFDNIYVLLATLNEFESVHAEIRSDLQSEAANLQIGQTISVACEGGGMIVGDPVLRNCSFQPVASAEQSSADVEPPQESQSQPTSEPSSQAADAIQSQASPGGSQASVPTVIQEAPAEYTDEARRNKLEGTVQVVLLVDENGEPQNVTVARPLGMGLDESAVEAVKQYKFKPAIDPTSGRPVPAQMSINVQFRLE